ncbi:hypothetical protein OAA13_02345 [Crocinitomicaceae bacterium]|nr:hypothetical protein [Crocinitomicaceae bacterium]MDC3308879.1 hypothetical protein [Crocinitomicaceae bacterium]
MKRLLLFFTICISSLSIGQVPVVEWSKSYGGSNADQCFSGQQTYDNGFILGGRTNNNSADFRVIRLNQFGDMVWDKTYGGSGYDQLYSIAQTQDDCYIMCGLSDSNDGDITGNNSGSWNQVAWVVKLDSVGNIIWENSYNSSFSNGSTNSAKSVLQTNDGGYIFLGLSYNGVSEDLWLAKLDSIGNLTWEKSFGGSSGELAREVIQTADSGFIIASLTYSNDGDAIGNHGSSDALIIKVDSLGNLIWSKVYGGSSEDIPNSIKQTTDGGFIIAGYTTSNDDDVSGNHGESDAWVLKLDINGDLIWSKCFGGSETDRANSIFEEIEGGFIVTGPSWSNDGDVTSNYDESNAWMFKLDSIGNLIWENTFGGSGTDLSICVQETTDSNFVFFGYSNSNNGDVTINNGNYDFWIVKLSSDGSSNLTELNPNQPKELIKIVNLLGQEVEYTPNTVLIYQYSDGTSEKVFTIED